MAAVKGKQKETSEFVKELFTGFTTVKVIAVNPDRAQINAMIGKQDKEDDKPVEYLGNDKEGNDRIRLAFWLEDVVTGKKFVHSFNLTDKERKNKEGDKVQIVNNTCQTTWAPYIKKKDKKGVVAVDDEGKAIMTDKVDETLVQDWFFKFTNKEKEVLGKKTFRKALAGEEELTVLLRVWLGRLDFMDPETDVVIDTKKLFKEDYSELRELISLDENNDFTDEGYDTAFVALLGVRTDEADATKKYQQIYAKSFLPNGFMKYINNGIKFPNEYTQKVWNKFEKEVNGDYGFDCFFELAPLETYNPAKDLSGGAKTAKEIPAPTDSNY